MTILLLHGKLLHFALCSLVFCLLFGGFFPVPAAGKSPPAAPVLPETSPGEVMDFDTCARLAIRQSPFLAKSDLEINVRKLDEKDSKSAFFPSFNFRTRYYLSSINENGVNSSRYSLEFVSEPFSPIEAYFSLQVRKIITKIAILTHFKAISESLNRLARMFLEMDALTQLVQIQTELIQIAQKNLNYMQEQQKIGQGSALELKVAAQELELARLQHHKLVDGLKKIKESIRVFINWPAGQELRFDLPKSKSQILGNVNLAKDPPEAHKDSSFDCKIAVLKEELQKYHIILAKTKFLPTLLMGAQTPDPLSMVESRSMFVYVGANIPVWDGFRRWRNVSRQKIILKQMESESNEKQIDFKEKWRTAQQNLSDTASDLEMSQSQLELASLKARRQEVRYHNFGEPFPIYLEGEKIVSEAKKNIAVKTMEHNQAQLTIRNLANDLVLNYVNEHSIPQRSEAKY